MGESSAEAGSETTRDRILAAALEVFAERGFDGARTREIAERAGANLGLIKYYFDGKEALWKGAVERAFAQLQASFGDALTPGSATDGRAQIESVIRRFVYFVAEHPEFMRLMNDEGKRDSPRMRWLAENYITPMQRLMQGQLELAQEVGLLPRFPAVSIFYLVVGAAGLIFSQAPECRFINGIDPTEEAHVAAHADAVVRLLLGPEASE